MKLLAPRPIRLKPAHDAFLRARADAEGHGNKALSLRLILDKEMNKGRDEPALGRSSETLPLPFPPADSG